MRFEYIIVFGEAVVEEVAEPTVARPLEVLKLVSSETIPALERGTKLLESLSVVGPDEVLPLTRKIVGLFLVFDTEWL